VNAAYLEKDKKGDKKMNNKIKFGLLLLAVSALILVPLASATPAYASKTGASCGTCHVSPGGGGTLTSAGNTFKNTGSLSTVTPPTTPAQSTTPTKVNDKIGPDGNNHIDINHQNGHKEGHDQVQEHNED
jgi:hypothetical protein